MDKYGFCSVYPYHSTFFYQGKEFFREVKPVTPTRICPPKKKNYGWIAFLSGLGLAAAVIIPIIIYGKGYFLYYGDFNVQEIPFYRLAHDAISSGCAKWSQYTDLGANFVGSYSFYLLGSPFFWLTMLIPSQYSAYTIGPLLILKLGLCSFTSYIYLRRYVRDRKFAVLGGLLYAFSGFSVYNIFFFHFHEPMIIFPLVLAALDEFHYTGRRGLVALSLCASAIINYYFFFGQALFCLIYYIVKLITKGYRFRIKVFLLLCCECVIGVVSSAVLLLPSLSAIMGNYRLGETLNGWNALLYNNTQRYLHIFISFFFPPDIPARPNFTPDSNSKWSSVAAFIPIFSVVFTAAFVKKRKKSFFTVLFTILIIMAFVPILNASFQALNTAFYTRWFYMLTLMMIVMTVYELEHIDECDFKKGFIFTTIVTLAVALIIGFMPYVHYEVKDIKIYRFGIENSAVRFWIFVAMSVVGLAIVFITYLLLRKKKKLFFRVICICLCLFIVGYSELYLIIGKRQTDYNDEFLQKYALTYSDGIDFDDIDTVRSDFFRSMDNIGMYWGVSNIQAFHSIVPGSLMEFYNTIGVKRDVGSRPDENFYGVRALTSVKYLFTQAKKSGFVKDGKTLMPGYTYIGDTKGFDTYLNENYIPYGFVYDQFICEEEFKELSSDVQHLALLKAMVLTQDQMKKYKEITGYQDGQYHELNAQYDEKKLQKVDYPEYDNYESITSDFVYSEEEYKNDCDKLKENTCTDFSYTEDGFKATFINSGDANLLFFSVPYDEGFRAYINGEEVEIEKVNIGFMAVKVEKDSVNEIEFKYTTPYLKEGMYISAVGGGLTLLYIILTGFFRSKRAYKRKFRIKQQKRGG